MHASWLQCYDIAMVTDVPCRLGTGVNGVLPRVAICGMFCKIAFL